MLKKSDSFQNRSRMKFVVLLLVVTLIVAIEAAPQAATTTTVKPGEHGNTKPCKGSSEESGRKRRDAVEGLKIL